MIAGHIDRVIPRTPLAWTWLLLGAGLVCMYAPTVYDLLTTIWATDEQGHGPIVLALIVWLISRRKDVFGTLELSAPNPKAAFVAFGFAFVLYALARSQGIKSIEMATSILYVIGALLLMKGPGGVRYLAFPIFFMAFLIPLPSVVVDTLTQPMKLAVSQVSAEIMYHLGYPVSRAGVILNVGPYQLLVADACAGLNTLFTLEALGLLYLNLVRYASMLRNIALAVLIVPISFAANVIRVITLCLVTYHLGDEAGQGFLHGFAGMVLFMSALGLIIVGDSFLRLISRQRTVESA
jgi:exosortase B